MRKQTQLAMMVAVAALFWGGLAREGFASESDPNSTLANSPGARSGALVFSDPPTVVEIRRARVFEEALLPTGEADPGAEDSRALAAMLVQYRALRMDPGEKSGPLAALGAAEEFLAAHPGSPWRATLQANLGLEYYATGYFSKALAAWREAWNLGRNEKPSSKAIPVIDRALGELCRMEARLGHMEELHALLAEAGNRPLRGMAAEAVQGAREGLWLMRSRPQDSFKCGPFALESILAKADPADLRLGELKAYPSTSEGTSLSQLVELADTLDLPARAVLRPAGAPIPVPCVIHWKLGHFAALLERHGTRYLLRDPTFGSSQWIEQAAIDEEASGNFLLTGSGAQALPEGWRALSGKETAAIWGKGQPTGSDPHSCGGGDKKAGGNGPKNGPKKDPCKKGGNGMAAWTVHLMLVSLNIQDIPVGYTPPAGPEIMFTVNYGQREANQPATFDYGNLGTRWNLEWISTMTFDSNNAYLHAGDGGTYRFPQISLASPNDAVSLPDAVTVSTVKRISTTVFHRLHPDGSLEIFTKIDPLTDRYYMTEVRDAIGNAVTLTFDGFNRLTQVTDACGGVSSLTYAEPDDDLLITKITDAYGREAIFEYNDDEELIRITDPEGLTSEFTYNPDGTVASLITGYGTTTFSAAEAEAGLTRTLLATYPDGSKEKWFAPLFASAALPTSEARVPGGMPLTNAFLQFRNTFYWDRKAMLEAPDDQTKAHLFHFAHSDLGQITGRLLESEKPPLQERIWYFYKGGVVANSPNENTVNLPTHVGRVLDDGSTQLYLYEYNSLGNMTRYTDPLGRVTQYTYDANGIDTTAIDQVAGASLERLGTLTYTAAHLPETLIDAAGQTTAFTYNARGQVLTTTDALSRVTTYTYDLQGFPETITGPDAGGTNKLIFTHDADGRIDSVTDALGYQVQVGYDNLDRITDITYPDSTQDVFDYTLLDLTTYVDRLGKITSFTYNSLGDRTSRTDPLLRTTRYEYCGCGGLTAIIDPLGRATRWEYDLAGRVTAKVYPDGQRVTYSYEASTSRTKSYTDPRGVTTQLRYHRDDTLSFVSFAGGAPTPSVVLKYDPYYQRLASMVDGTGTTTYNYHPVAASPVLGAGKLASVQNTRGLLEYIYDELGRVKTRKVDGVAETIVFDTQDRPATVTDALGTFTFSYLEDPVNDIYSDKVTGVLYPNGQETLIQHYNGLGDFRVQQIRHELASNATLSQHDYTYNARGELTQWAQLVGAGSPRVWTPASDDARQLTGITSTVGPNFAYTYDLLGNRLTETIDAATTTAGYNSLNELTDVVPPLGPERQFEWDADNRLSAIVYPAASGRTEFSYDGVGRLVKIVEKTGATVDSTRQFLWDGDRMVKELDGAAQATRLYFERGMKILNGPDAGEYFYTRDHLGSVRELTDDTGAVRARYDYDPFGRETKLSGDLNSAFGFTGLYRHERSGLLLAVFRAYDPAAGRWISRDPLEEEGGLNLYAYVQNQTLSLTDPLGLFSTAETATYAAMASADAITLADTLARLPSLPDTLDTVTNIGANSRLIAIVGFHGDAGIAGLLYSALRNLWDEIAAEKRKKCPDKKRIAELERLEVSARVKLEALRRLANNLAREGGAQNTPFQNPMVTRPESH